MRILVVDDPPHRYEPLAQLVARACPAAQVERVSSAHGLGADPATVMVVGPGVPSAVDVVRAVCARRPDAVAVVVGREDRAADAVAVMKAGAADYIALGDGLADALTGALALLGRGEPPTRPIGAEEPLAGLVGASRVMEHVRALVRTAARAEAPVLVEGETGTGKEVVARAVHALGRRSALPFVPMNCAAIPEALAESEFFGHTRGAFTGALESRPGALRLADRGTLFLDEIEDLPLVLQAKLLRVIQDGEVRPLGASAARRVDVRLIAASNRDLWRMVEAGQFRRDLYYRLRVLTIHLPPLRQRREDLPRLIEHFIARFNRTHGVRFASPPVAALRPLLEHAWPGNVRELENTIESLLIQASASGRELAALLREQSQMPLSGLWIDERTRILRVLEDHRWNRQRAAAALGISRVTLWRRMERHGIRDPLGGAARETA